MAWIFLIFAGIFEMLGVLSIAKFNLSRHWNHLLLLFFFFCLSFVLLSLSMREIAMGTAYAVWTGIGASGGAVLGMIFYDEPREWQRLVCICLIIGAVIGLKLIT